MTDEDRAPSRPSRDVDPGTDPVLSLEEAGALDDYVRAIHEHLEATQERPVERDASRWIGEAEAVTRDLATGDPDPQVVVRRLEHVVDLLAEVEDTEDPAATDHVERAAALTADALDAHSE